MLQLPNSVEVIFQHKSSLLKPGNF